MIAFLILIAIACGLIYAFATENYAMFTLAFLFSIFDWLHEEIRDK